MPKLRAFVPSVKFALSLQVVAASFALSLAMTALPARLLAQADSTPDLLLGSRAIRLMVTRTGTNADLFEGRVVRADTGALIVRLGDADGRTSIALARHGVELDGVASTADSVTARFTGDVVTDVRVLMPGGVRPRSRAQGAFRGALVGVLVGLVGYVIWDANRPAIQPVEPCLWFCQSHHPRPDYGVMSAAVGGGAAVGAIIGAIAGRDQSTWIGVPEFQWRARLPRSVP
ncbi:MAG: hypothetical protein HY275_18845 [Gemmatimonadetes bacterium]|nr:hypothetical protein [Gemmatimonadota bacterium]